MYRIMGNVKSKRRYDSSGRQAQARRTREAILSVETVYKAFGGKPGLVRAIYERGLTGRGPVPAFERADAMRERESDPETIMRNWGALTSEVSLVVSPILLLVRAAAASDPDMAALFEASNDTRDERARHHARFLKERGYLRQGVTLAEATDILWTCTSPELYDLLVQQRGWSLPRFARFLADYMIATLRPGERDRG